MPSAIAVPSPRGAEVLIASQVLTAPQASFDTSTLIPGGVIPGTYDHLRLVLVLRTTAAAAADAVFIRYNNDATAGNYVTQRAEINGTGFTVAESIGTVGGGYLGIVPGATAPAALASSMSCEIDAYAGTTFDKVGQAISMMGAALTSTNLHEYINGHIWASTAAITRIQVVPNTGPNFAAGSAFYLYGVTAGASGSGSGGTSGAGADGWTDAAETWTYSSVDGPTGVFTVAADVTGKYSPGMRIRFTQTTVKYGIITKVSTFSGGVTTITFYGGTDYTLANAAISANSYSTARAPFGFPAQRAKWTTSLVDTAAHSQTTPTDSVWYNLGGSLDIPIGEWEVEYYATVVYLYSGDKLDGRFRTALSTTNNGATDGDLVNLFNFGSTTVAFLNQFYFPSHRRKSLSLAAKTTYYLNVMSESGIAVQSLQIAGSVGTTFIRAVCAYL